MKVLENEVAIITGASSGIGRATAKLFGREGARVVVNARRQPPLDELVAEIAEAGGEAIALAGDVKDEAVAESLVEAAVSNFGSLSIAFNNVGGYGEMAAVQDMSLAGWQDAIETNLTSAFLGAKHQIPAMLQHGGGSLIFTSSFVGCTAGMPNVAAYAASKAGLTGLVQVLAVEFGTKGIRANAILPGGTDTPANVANFPDSGPEVREFVDGLHALKRIASPEEIAGAALFLASDAASFVTGSSFLVDGGVSISRT